MNVKRIFGGFGIYDANGKVIATFNGTGAKKRAEAALELAEKQIDLPLDEESEAENSGRGLRGRGGAYRGQ